MDVRLRVLSLIAFTFEPHRENWVCQHILLAVSIYEIAGNKCRLQPWNIGTTSQLKFLSDALFTKITGMTCHNSPNEIHLIGGQRLCLLNKKQFICIQQVINSSSQQLFIGRLTFRHTTNQHP